MFVGGRRGGGFGGGDCPPRAGPPSLAGSVLVPPPLPAAWRAWHSPALPAYFRHAQACPHSVPRVWPRPGAKAHPAPACLPRDAFLVVGSWPHPADPARKSEPWFLIVKTERMCLLVY